MTRFSRVVVVGLFIVVSLVTCSLANAEGCQNQTCLWSNVGNCFRCAGADKLKCTIGADCSSCLERKCQDSGGEGNLCAAPTVENLDWRTLLRTSAEHKLDGLDITLSMFSPKNGPVEMVEAMFGREVTLKRAAIKNTGNKKISEVQIGWLTVSTRQTVILSTEQAQKLTEPLFIGQTGAVSNVNVPSDVFKQASAVVFFVASVKFEDGTSWKEDTREVKKQALKGIRSKHSDGRSKA
jgi:hypothetical protein